MKISEKIANNQIGVLLTVAHWIALFAASSDFFGGMVDSGAPQPGWGIVAVPILIIDFPAIFLAALLCSPLFIIAEDKTMFFYGVFLTSLFTISFQWLSVCNSLFGKSGEKATLLSLNDD